jgi:hypothetical protein
MYEEQSRDGVEESGVSVAMCEHVCPFVADVLFLNGDNHSLFRDRKHTFNLYN